jgi:hypothetical protein
MEGEDDSSPKRHSSMDELMGLMNDLGKSTRQRSLSDGENGVYWWFYYFESNKKNLILI